MHYTTQYVESIIKKLEETLEILERVKKVAKELRKDKTCPDWSEELDKALKGE